LGIGGRADCYRRVATGHACYDCDEERRGGTDGVGARGVADDGERRRCFRDTRLLEFRLVKGPRQAGERAGPALRAPGPAAGGTASQSDGKNDGELIPWVEAVVGVGPGVRDARAHAVSVGVTGVGRATMRGDGGESWCQQRQADYEDQERPQLQTDAVSG